MVDYYLTTIFENRRNALKPLQRNGFNGRLLSPEICAESLKALLSQGFPFVCQKTPTLKAAGSNPVGRTKSSKNAVFRAFL